MTISPPTQRSSTSEKAPEKARDALASLRIDRPNPLQSRKSGRTWLWIITLLILLGVGFFGYRFVIDRGWASDGGLAGSTWMPEMMQNRVEVRLASVTVQQGRSADAVVVATGYLRSRRQAKIGARAVGRMDKILFEEGDRVKVGQILAELEHKDLDASWAASVATVARAQAALAEQEITIEQAEIDEQRLEGLWKSRSISESEYDVARFAYRSAVARRDSLKADIALAEAQKDQVEQLRDNMYIRAPFDGTVISKDAEVGESITPGGLGAGSGRGSVATIADLDNLEIECDVQEDFISRVTEGQEADIAVDAVQDKKYHGIVRKIIPMGDRARATIKVEVTITDADGLLFPEMAGTVFFLPTEKEMEINDEPRYFCPTSAVDSDEQGTQFVWIADSEKRAQQIAVQVGDDRDGRVEILEGLTGKERVIVNPEDLHVGTPLRIVE